MFNTYSEATCCVAGHGTIARFGRVMVIEVPIVSEVGV